jgi:hypothetical protein
MPIELHFKGFFECRLATDPDPFDEPRGVSGWTFALPGEPDLDRFIRFQSTGAVLRWGGPAIGVKVWQVVDQGAAQPAHPLVGASVRFGEASVFEGRNGLVAPSGFEPVFPFEISIEAGAFSCRRAMNDPGTNRPQLVMSSGRGRKPALLVEAGITDIVTYRAQRAKTVADRLAIETDPRAKAGLKKRKNMLDQPSLPGVLMWGPVPAEYFVDYDYTLSAPSGVLNDPAGVLKDVDLDSPWQARFSLGGWDADALAGFASGALTLPQIVPSA